MMKPMPGKKPCPMCGGKGKVPDKTGMVHGRMKPCPKCDGEKEDAMDDKGESEEE